MIEAISEFARKVGVFTTSFIAALLLVMTLIVFLAKAVDSGIYVAPILLPENLQELGYTGEIISNQIIDGTIKIRNEAREGLRENETLYLPKRRTSDNRYEIGSFFDDLVLEIDDLHFETAGTRFSLTSTVRYFRRQLSWNHTRITGEIVCSSADCAEHINLHLRFEGGGDEVLRPKIELTGGSLQEVLESASMKMIESIDPLILGYSEFSNRSFGNAKELARKAFLQRNQNSHKRRSHALNLWGNSLRELGDLKGAKEKYTQAINIFPKALTSQIMDSPAKRAFRTRVPGSSSDHLIGNREAVGRANFNLGLTLLDIGRGIEERSERHKVFRLARSKFIIAEKLSPDFAAARHKYAYSFSLLGDRKRAIKEYEIAIRRYEANSDRLGHYLYDHTSKVSLAELYFLEGQKKDAEILLDELIINKPEDTIRIYQNWAKGLIISGAYESVESVYIGASEESRKNRSFIFLRAFAKFLAGDFGASVKIMNKISSEEDGALLIPLWHFLISYQASQNQTDENASNANKMLEMRYFSARRDGNEEQAWLIKKMELFLKRIEPDDFMFYAENIETTNELVRKLEANFYVGYYHLMKKNYNIALTFFLEAKEIADSAKFTLYSNVEFLALGLCIGITREEIRKGGDYIQFMK